MVAIRKTKYVLPVRNHTGALKRTRKVPALNGAGFQRIRDDEAEYVFTSAQRSDFSLICNNELPFRNPQHSVDYD